VPQYCVNIGLWLGGEAVVGVTLDPRLNELYTAARGQGAFLNGERIRVSAAATLSAGLFSTGFPAGYEAQKPNLVAWAHLSQFTQALRRTGSTAINMAYVAAGSLDSRSRGETQCDRWHPVRPVPPGHHRH
jgi:myo-inositol-1(or 4)-monophosphatase